MRHFCKSAFAGGLGIATAVLSIMTHGSAAPLVGAGDNSTTVVRDDHLLWGVRPNHASPSALKLGTAWSVIDSVAERAIGIDSNGGLWTWGSYLGIDGLYSSLYPVQIGTDSKWQSVSAHDSYTLAVKQDGTLWGWGSFYAANVVVFESNVPVRVGSASNWRLVTGSYYNLGIRNDGSLWAWGHNGHGNLGDGTYNSRIEPVRVGNAVGWKSAASVGYTSFGIKEDGSLWAWGANGGAYGNGATASSTVPVRVGTDNNWLKISGEDSVVLALKTDGSLWSWGANSGGMLGLGATTFQSVPARIGTGSNWMDVSAGRSHVIAVRADNSIWAWGNNANGEFGVTDVSASNVPLDVSAAFVPVPRFTIYESYGYEVSDDRLILSLEPVIQHEPKDFEIRIRNNGFAPLNLSTDGLPSFTTLLPPTVAGLSDVILNVRLDATAVGYFAGQLLLNSNDSSRPVFTVSLYGWVVSPTDDTDGDGLNDAAEVALAPLGFEWRLAQTAKVTEFFENAGFAGLFQAGNIQDVEWKAGAPSINASAQTIQIPLELRDSSNGSGPLITPENVREAAGGSLEMTVPLKPGKRFVRLKAP